MSQNFPKISLFWGQFLREFWDFWVPPHLPGPGVSRCFQVCFGPFLSQFFPEIRHFWVNFFCLFLFSPFLAKFFGDFLHFQVPPHLSGPGEQRFMLRCVQVCFGLFWAIFRPIFAKISPFLGGILSFLGGFFWEFWVSRCPSHLPGPGGHPVGPR